MSCDRFFGFPHYIAYLIEDGVKIGMSVTPTRQFFDLSDAVRCLHGPFKPKLRHATSATHKLHIVLCTKMSLPFSTMCVQQDLAGALTANAFS